MITKEELQEAIEELQQKPCNFALCEKLSTLYIIYDHLYAEKEEENNTNTETLIDEYGNTDFLQAIKGKNSADVWAVVDELMTTVSILNERLYDSVMRKIK